MRAPASQILPDLTGKFIDDGSLELLCLLGSGAYGKVYKALDTTSPPHDLAYYAVKCMPRYDPDSLEAEIQENELRMHLMLSDHPLVITFHRHFFTDEFVFVVLELATGGDLFSAMVDRKLFRGKPTLIKQVLGELLDAVEVCHRNSIFHRDIKPENILCNSEGTDIRLADFGLATQISVSGHFGCGTKHYMCPESLDRAYTDGGCYSTRHGDLWAVSIIFTIMVSGHPPWSIAEPSDRNFAAFQTDSDYLVKALRITPPTHALLKWCFDINPLRRPTLPQFRAALNDIETFSLPDVRPPAPRVLRPHIPSLGAVRAPSSAAEECPTPRPAFPPVYAPQPIKRRRTPFVLDPFLFSPSSTSFSVAPTPPAPSSPAITITSSSSSSSPSSLPSSGSSALSSVASAADSSPPATPATFPADLVDVRVYSISSLAGESEILVPVPAPMPALALPPRAYLRPFRPVPAIPTKPTEYRTVAANARPTLPTRRQFLTARRLRIQVKE
ncbi:kinase-like domain-containing protein [Mycena capillaripes]|nr:kinase-like domain-containing protein [Mycena capillaripes]